MQRRAAAACFLFFVVLGLIAYALLTFTKVPTMRAKGLWSIMILCLISAVLVIGAAYLPVRG